MRRWLPFLLILLIAAVARLIALPGVPPGLQHDEVFHGHDAVTVLLGQRPLYFTSNAGNEPLFIYLMSLTVGLFGHTAWGIRLAAVLCGLLALFFTHLWIRRAYGERAALMASALLAVSFWPLFLSRVGLRAASVPMMTALTTWLLFEALHRQQRRWFVLTGIALGVSLYTYPAARALPIVYLLFWVLISIAARRINKPLLLTLVTAFIVFAPLGYTIATLPEADVRLQQLGGPVQEALTGNFEPVLRYTFATLGMFNVAGDPIARYNVPGRPVFDVITGLLFLVGIGWALRHWREPRNLFALLWLPIGLLPSMLSDSAPSFLRASASLPVAFLFPALALDWLFMRVMRPSTAPLRGSAQDARRRSVIGYALITGLIIFTGGLTLRDYFFAWSTRSDVREVYRSDLAAAARWIEQQPSDQSIVVAGTNPRDLDPFLFDFQLAGRHEVKWIDRAFTIVYPAQLAKLISPAYSPIDPQLRDRFLLAPTFVSPFEDGAIAFEVYDLVPRLPSPAHTAATADKADQLTAPIDVNRSLEFLGYEASSSVKPGEGVTLTLYWRVKQDVGAQQLPLSLFVHLLNERGEFAAGRDLLAFPTAGWRNGDVWLQQNDVPLPADLKPGKYLIELGVYSQADGSRWRVYDAQGQDVGDRLLLSEIEVQP
ncbi:MAG TPA: glycosyltransferase family 39 protein [Anaerolineae bacterium]|nr:glycosyltransferase family 39 protein [Anaerolineae bacterium]